MVNDQNNNNEKLREAASKFMPLLFLEMGFDGRFGIARLHGPGGPLGPLDHAPDKLAVMVAAGTHMLQSLVSEADDFYNCDFVGMVNDASERMEELEQTGKMGVLRRSIEITPPEEGKPDDGTDTNTPS